MTVLPLRALASVFALALLVVACGDPVIPAAIVAPTAPPTATPTTPPQQTETATPVPADAEPGLTDRTMRIAVISDGPSSGLDVRNVSEDVWQAMEAWAEHLNDGDLLAGRRVIVERLDAGVFNHAQMIDRVCNGDFFAIVGSWALNDDEGLDQLTSPSCRVPDFPAEISSFERLDSNVTFASNPSNGLIWNAGWAAYFAAAYPEAVQAAGVGFVELPNTVIHGNRMIEAASAEGYQFDGIWNVPVDTDFTVEAQELIDNEIRSLTWRGSADRLLVFLEAIAAIDPEYRLDFIDCGQACYDSDGSWGAKAGPLGADVHVWLPTRPLDEADLNGELSAYLSSMFAAHGDDAVRSVAGLQAWASALLFEQAVNDAIGQGTADYDPDALSRRRVIAAARRIHEWDAHGLHGPADPAAGIPAPCVVVLTLRDGIWVRAFPEGRNQFACSDEYLVELVHTVDIGEEPTPTPEPTPSATAEPEATATPE